MQIRDSEWKNLDLVSGIRDGKNSDPGWKKIRIWDKHPGSATVLKVHFSKPIFVRF
jgi:hypothetical protein